MSTQLTVLSIEDLDEPAGGQARVPRPNGAKPKPDNRDWTDRLMEDQLRPQGDIDPKMLRPAPPTRDNIERPIPRKPRGPQGV